MNTCPQKSLDELHIPFHIITHSPRRAIPSKVISLLELWGATKLFANMEYEVDELRRDIKTCELAKKNDIQCVFMHDKLIVRPGELKTKGGKQYAVRIPFFCGS